MPESIDPGAGYVLEGRVVTMGPAGVLEDGAIYVRGDTIAAVQPASEAPPAGFEGAPRVRTGDTIYPGLIEIHNHLSYNAMPLWDVPRRYTNHEGWKRHDEYRSQVTKPAQTLGRTPEVAPSVVRFVECRALLGGATASQGITLYRAPGIQSVYRGVVRNVEQPLDDRLPNASTRIGDPSSGGADDYLDNLEGRSCYLQHLSEGVGERARSWFHRLRLGDGSWAITDALCGIHSLALTAEDFAVLAAHGGTMCWSPSSNYLLYGVTADVAAAKRAGVTIGIGCDWAPSGTKNLLGELKVAHLASEEQGGVFTAEEIAAMATRNGARILKWDRYLGTIEPGKLADFVAVNGHGDDDYLHLIEARETSLTLVVIGGVPRVGQRWLMEQFGGGTEEIQVGGSERVLNLAQDDAHELVQGLTLTDATSRLREAMANLPELARELDRSDAEGLYRGAAGEEAGGWGIRLDFEEEDAALERELGIAAAPLADYVEPMELEGITVADDPGFLDKLAASRNLPEFVKRGLPPLYGEEVSLPSDAEFLREAPDGAPAELLETTGDLARFLRSWGELRLADLRRIVDQARVVLEENYVHLPLKRSMYAADPVQRLTLLRQRLGELEEEDLPPEIEIHRELADVFNELRDLHTSYRLPYPFKGKVAWLPYLIESFWDRGRRRYVVTRRVGEAGPASFEPGVEVTHWNGVPIARAVERHAERQPGGNRSARHERGLESLTIRPLSRGFPPEEEWVTLRYLDGEGETRDYTQRWLMFEPGRGRHNLDPEELLRETVALGLDDHADEIQQAKKLLFAAPAVASERAAVERGGPRAAAEGELATDFPTVLRARRVETEHGVFGYLRIFTFNVQSASAFVNEVARLIDELPPDGLVLDIRGNPGGLIHAAERSLQLFTPRRVEPEPAQFACTPLNLRICRAHAPSERLEHLDLAPWVPSIERSTRTGATYSRAYPLTDPALANELGQRYHGPVVLVVDALSYSAADLFAAGFQDHEIGPVLGVCRATGAGGANVWSHRVLRELLGEEDGEGATYRPLPRGADLRVAIRRTVRVAEHAGTIVEDFGVEPGTFHAMTRRDVLGANEDLLETAGRLLAEQTAHHLAASLEDGPSGPRLTVRTRHLTRLDVLAGGRPLRSLDIQDGETALDLPAEPPHDLELIGYHQDTLALRYHLRGRSSVS